MPDRMKRGRNADTICILAAIALSAATLTLTGTLPGSVSELVPAWVGLAWASVYTVSAGLSLTGVLWRDELTGWGIELTGRIPLAVTSLLYFAMLRSEMTSFGTWIVLAIVGAIGVASVIRAFQLTRDTGKFKEASVAIREARGPRT